MANESVGETKDVSLPHLVRIGTENKWTMAIQPSEKYFMQRMSDNTEEVFSVSSTTPFPRFSNEKKILIKYENWDIIFEEINSDQTVKTIKFKQKNIELVLEFVSWK